MEADAHSLAKYQTFNAKEQWKGIDGTHTDLAKRGMKK